MNVFDDVASFYWVRAQHASDLLDLLLEEPRTSAHLCALPTPATTKAAFGPWCSYVGRALRGGCDGNPRAPGYHRSLAFVYDACGAIGGQPFSPRARAWFACALGGYAWIEKLPFSGGTPSEQQRLQLARFASYLLACGRALDGA